MLVWPHETNTNSPMRVLLGHNLWPEVVVYSVQASAAHALTRTCPTMSGIRLTLWGESDIVGRA